MNGNDFKIINEKRIFSDNYFSSYNKFCSGYLDNPNGHYVVLPYLGVASITKQNLPRQLEEIIAFDAAQVSFANTGKINAIAVSSFIGPKGRLAGYDFFSSSDEIIGTIKNINICTLNPLLNATSRVLGTIKNSKYPFFPGSMVPCALKDFYSDEAGRGIYSGLAISIPKNKFKEPFLLMEDVGFIDDINEDYFNKAALSSIHIANLQNMDIDKIYISKKEIDVKKNGLACALVMCSYVHLPKNIREELEIK